MQPVLQAKLYRSNNDYFVYMQPLYEITDTWIRVIPENSLEAKLDQAGLAVFNTESGRFAALEKNYSQNCALPKEIVFSSPIERGNFILGVLVAYGERLNRSGHIFNLRAVPGTQLLDSLEEIEKVREIWITEIELFPSKDQIHKKKNNSKRKNSAIVSRNREIFVKTKHQLRDSQKRVMSLYEIVSKTTFITFKLIKPKESKLPQDKLINLEKRFAREINIYKELLKKQKEGLDLSHILIPKTFLEYESEGKEKSKIVLPKKDCDLSKFLDSEAIPEDKVYKVVYEMIKGVFNFHKAFPGTYHGDIKLNNFLITMESFDIFLIDFGILFYEDRTILSATTGTRGYKPPEGLGPFKVPMNWEKWCSMTLGLALIYLLDGKTVCKDRTKEETIQFLNDFHSRPMAFPKLEPLVKGLTKIDPKERISIEEALSLAANHYKK